MQNLHCLLCLVLLTFDRFALILQAEEIVDVINDLQQAIVSQQAALSIIHNLY